MTKKSRAVSMTEGAPLKLILTFMAPVLLGQLVQQTYNMVDAMIVGRILGADALASVGASSSVQFMILGFVSGCSDGFAINVAQRFGASDESNMRRYEYHSYILAALFAFLIAVSGALLTPGIIGLLKTPDNIKENAITYLFIIFAGIPFTFMYNIQASVLRAIGNSRIPFIFLAISAGLNVILDLIFVWIFKWGVAGAAAATVISQALSGIFCAVYIIKYALILHPSKQEMKLRSGIFLKLIAMGVPMGLQFSITAIGSMVMQSGNNSLGSEYVSGYTAGDRVEQFVMCPYVALSSSVATYVGQNYGALKFDRVRKGVKDSIVMAHIYGLIFGSLMALFGKNVAGLFLPSGSDDIVSIAGRFLWYVGFMFFLVSSVNVYRPAMQGMGKPMFAIVSGIIEMAARSLFVISTIKHLGYTTICLTHQAAWVSAGIYVFIMYHIVVNRLEREVIAAGSHISC